jgi:acyl carrier protein
MDIDLLRSTVRRIVGELAPLGPRQARPTDRLSEDLGYDSLGVIELSLRLEQEFGLVPESGPEGHPDIATVADIEEFVAQQLIAPSDVA